MEDLSNELEHHNLEHHLEHHKLEHHNPGYVGQDDDDNDDIDQTETSQAYIYISPESSARHKKKNSVILRMTEF